MITGATPLTEIAALLASSAQDDTDHVQEVSVRLGQARCPCGDHQHSLASADQRVAMLALRQIATERMVRKL